MDAEILASQDWVDAEVSAGVRKEPPWKHAVDSFLLEGFAPGSIVPHEWFYRTFGITPPKLCRSVSEAQSAQLAFLSNIEGLKRELLEEHQIALRSARGVGYEVVPPQEQTEWAEEECKEDLRKALRTSRLRLLNVQLDMLTDEQKKLNTDALARLSFFKKQARKALNP